MISPRIVIPDSATPEQRKAAKKYVDAVAKIQKREFGRDLKPQVLTRSQNKRGRSNAFHTEGFAVTDEKFLQFLNTPEGRSEYQDILRNTLGKMSGVEFFLPHSAEDPGATNNKGVSEVAIARLLMQGL